MIKKLAILSLCFCATTLSSHSQHISGKYTGKLAQASSFSANPKGKKFKLQKHHLTKTLEIKNDSSFSFSYSFLNIYSAQGLQTRHCEGYWTIHKDTLILTSRYPMHKFYTVEEHHLTSCETDLIKIALTEPDSMTPVSWITFAEVYINKVHFGKCRFKDTLYCKSRQVEEIVLKSYSPFRMEWYYTPEKKNSNYFAFRIKTDYKGDNISLKNYKLLIKKDKLIPLTEGPLNIDIEAYHK